MTDHLLDEIGPFRVVTGRDRDNPDAVGCEIHDSFGRTATIYGEKGYAERIANEIVNALNYVREPR